MSQSQARVQPPEESSGGALEYQTDLPVGEILRRTRIHYGLGLSDVERALRIRESLIQAIEQSDNDNLPGRVYAIGFVRCYSEYLGFDGDQVVSLFKQQTKAIEQQNDHHFPTASRDSQIPSWYIIVGALVVLAVFVGGWNYFNPSITPPVQVIPAVEEVFNNSDIVQNEPVKGPMPVAQTNEQEGILINVIENSWVEIRDAQGNPIVSRVLQAGERYFVPDRPDLKMSIGNAAGLELFVNGQQIPALGGRGDMLKDIVLDAEELMTRSVFSVMPKAEQPSSNALETP